MKKVNGFIVLFLISLNAYSEGPFVAPMPIPQPIRLHATQVNVLVRPVVNPVGYGGYPNGGYQQGYQMYPGYGGYGYGRRFCWHCYKHRHRRRSFFVNFSSFGRRGGFSFGLGSF